MGDMGDNWPWGDFFSEKRPIFNLLQGQIQSWTLGGHNPEVDFGAISFFFCEKFLNTIFCYRKHCRMGGWPPAP